MLRIIAELTFIFNASIQSYYIFFLIHNTLKLQQGDPLIKCSVTIDDYFYFFIFLKKGDYVMRILRRAFLLVADKVFIEFSKYR